VVVVARGVLIGLETAHVVPKLIAAARPSRLLGLVLRFRGCFSYPVTGVALVYCPKKIRFPENRSSMTARASSEFRVRRRRTIWSSTSAFIGYRIIARSAFGLRWLSWRRWWTNASPPAHHFPCR